MNTVLTPPRRIQNNRVTAQRGESKFSGRINLPLGGVIWDDEYTIDELIFKNGVYYYNQNSEEWEEDDEDAWA